MQRDAPEAGLDPPDTFSCPRCGREVLERFWGPCSSCRNKLVHTQVRPPAEAELARFEPAAHVVPNHVATRD